jgi:hypothetical protein
MSSQAFAYPRRCIEAMGEKRHTRLRRIVVCLRVAIGASSNYVTVATMPKANEKTSRLVCFLTEIA